MDQIKHKYITVQGLKLHVADIGTGPNVVVFLHGFPEIWYTWRHQTTADTVSPTYRLNPTRHPTVTSSMTSLQFLKTLLFLRFSWSQKILEVGGHTCCPFFTQIGSWEL